MTPSDLTRIEAIRERLAKATSGSWFSSGRTVWLARASAGLGDDGRSYVRHDKIADATSESDAAFIAHAWEDIAWLLARLAPATPSGAAIAEHSPDDANTREERTR